MKAIKTLFFVFTLLSLTSVLAKTPPSPGPAAKNSSTAADGDIPGGGNPGLPIDENIVFLTMAGLALGVTVLYRNKIKKASI